MLRLLDTRMNQVKLFNKSFYVRALMVSQRVQNAKKQNFKLMCSV
jgi:hypothetical protein